ncbi:MAG: hypothetical protein ACK50A_12095 [Sphingobacteriaceae bacterium]
MAKKVIKKETAKKAAKKVVKKAVKKAPVKKETVKKSVFKKPDVPKLLGIFNKIKKEMMPYSPPFNVRINIEGKYDLWSEKDIEAFGRKYDSMMLAAIIIQSGYVGFYFLPIYENPALKEKFSPAFVKLLKGKSCFHVKELNDEILSEIKKALEIGHDAYKKKGWI